MTLGAQGQFIDRPTITYAPLVGERFARAFMAPIPPPAILSLIQAGNPVDLVLRLTVNVVNGIQNRFGGDLRARPADPEFHQLLERLRRIQLSGAIGMRVHRVDRDEGTPLTLRAKVDRASRRTSWPSGSCWPRPRNRGPPDVYGSAAANDRELAILSRSILQLLTALSSFISVPRRTWPTVAWVRRRNPTRAPAGPSGP